MRILLLVHSFNSLSQRLYIELERDGHELSVEFDIHERVTCEAAELFQPDVIVAPFLKRAIPAQVWARYPCFVVHPGPPGDRGPSSLDWAILRNAAIWGVTVLQANAQLDAGPVWASARFAMRAASKSSLYRNEVTEAAVNATRAALARLTQGLGPLPALPMLRGWQSAPSAADRAVDWQRDDSTSVLRKIHSADGYPGVEDTLFDRRFRLFDARAEGQLTGAPGMLLARDAGAICRATCDAAVWIGQLKPMDIPGQAFKRPAVAALGVAALDLPYCEAADVANCGVSGSREIRYEERGPVGYLAFDFYNGALSTAQCERLRAAYAQALRRQTRVVVLLGGSDFWSNGMHLHCIEAADSPADASWHNINAIDDLAQDILTTTTHLTIAALSGNAAAGGVFLALAADRVLARSGVVLNPHYRNMGNLYGSEYWTYLLPRRVGVEASAAIMARRLPLGAAQARALGLIDAHAGPSGEEFRALVEVHAAELSSDSQFAGALAEKREARARDERVRALATYRADELEQMRLNFYGFDPSYHIARYRFVQRTAHAWTPLHLARHRRLGVLSRNRTAPA